MNHLAPNTRAVPSTLTLTLTLTLTIPLALPAAAMPARSLVPSSHALPDGLDAASFRRALVEAAEAWNRSGCLPFALEVSAPAPHRLAQEDGRNVVVFRPGDWCHNERCGAGRTFPTRAAAMTTVYPEGGGVREVREADIELNAASFDWTLDEEDDRPHGTGRQIAPLEAVLAHELGHLLGLRDTCGSEHGGRAKARASCSADERESLMFSGSTRTAPSPWDRDQLCAAFGTVPRAARGPLATLWRMLALAAIGSAAAGLLFLALRRRRPPA
jgi:hypothetical protein